MVTPRFVGLGGSRRTLKNWVAAAADCVRDVGKLLRPLRNLEALYEVLPLEGENSHRRTKASR